MKPLGLPDPRRIGPYRIFAQLGRGGMGRVFLAGAPDGRLVALKLVHAQHVEEPGFRERFRREVAASRRVSGAYTAPVVDADVETEIPWLATAFVPGPSLRQAIDAAGPLPPQTAARLAAGLATALGAIHAAGLVHRDLKPSNVLLAADGPRVIDFGVARATDGNTSELTHTGWLVGSPGYMSPEQAESKSPDPGQRHLLARCGRVYGMHRDRAVHGRLDTRHALQRRARRAGPGRRSRSSSAAS